MRADVVAWIVFGAQAVLGCPLTAQQQPAAGLPHLLVTVTAQGRPLADAEIRGAGMVALTGPDGRAILTLTPGPHRVVVWRIGYSTDTLDVSLPPRGAISVSVELTAVAVELAPIVVQSTRVPKRVEDVPERIEVMAPEDVQEKTLTSPGDLTNLLVEMGGVHAQSVAPGLGGTTVRVQGLPGRYTLLLVDGLPAFGAQPSSFSLTQIPPVDLAQVEVIKGAATALYGPSALGGVVDLIPRTPGGPSRMVLSRSTRAGTDAVAWLSGRHDEAWGYTALAGVHRQGLRDVSGDGWADVPGYTRVEARPRLFWTKSDGSSLMTTAGGTWEERRGGTVPGSVTPAGGAFPESLDTRHADAGAVGRLALSPGTSMSFRTSLMRTWRDRTFGALVDHERRSTLFAEASLAATRPRHSMVLGAAGQLDAFHATPDSRFDYRFATTSVFASDTYTPGEAVAVTASARVDHHDRYGTFISPRASALWRVAPGWSLRASVGTGFAAPTPDGGAEGDAGFHGLVPTGTLRAERGRSASLDVQGTVGVVELDATLFAARIADPVLPEPVSWDPLHARVVNAPGPIRSTGAEVFAVYGREPFLVTATYSHTRATQPSFEGGGRMALPLTPRNNGGVDVAWEDDEPGESGLRLALEVFYTGRQRVEDDPYREHTPGFATVDILASWRFGSAEIFANGENLTNVRQTRWDPLLLPSPGRGGRWTTEEWAPLEGRRISAGVQLRF